MAFLAGKECLEEERQVRDDVGLRFGQWENERTIRWDEGMEAEGSLKEECAIPNVSH